MKGIKKKQHPSRGLAKETKPTEILPDAVYIVKETANILRVSYDTMRKIIENKQIECSDITGTSDYRISGHSIIEFLQQKSVLNKE